MPPVERPIGYWLKHLHDLIEARFDGTLADLQLDRRHWQALNLLSSGPQTRAQLVDAMAPFWTDPESGPDGLLDSLRSRGWADTAPEGLSTLTDEGRAVHATIAARIHKQREAVMHGLTREQYAETVRILAAMSANLETGTA